MERPKSTRSTDCVARKKGQLRLALFFATFAANTAQAQVQIDAGFEQFASSGFLKPDHWLNQPMEQNDRTHWLAQRMTATAGYQLDNWRLGISREKQAYARANSSALVLAAQDKARDEVDLSAIGRFPLHAEIWKLSTTTFSAAYAWHPSPNVSLELEPFLQTIHDFEFMNGDLLLTNDGRQSQVTGQIKKIGTRSYGFLFNDQPDQGWGSGLNLRGNWNSPWGKLGLAVHNAWNRQQFSVIHQSERQYNVTATGNKLNIADLPSVTGQYSLSEKNTHLPVFWRLIYTPAPITGLTVGAMGLGQQAAWTAGYSGHWAEGHWWLHTSQVHNWTVGYGRSWGHGWKASLAISTDKHANAPLLSSIQLSKTW